MDIRIAEQILMENEQLYLALDRIADVIELIDDIDERRKFRRAVGMVMGDAHHLLHRQIVQQFPDLDRHQNARGIYRSA